MERQGPEISGNGEGDSIGKSSNTTETINRNPSPKVHADEYSCNLLLYGIDLWVKILSTFKKKEDLQT